MPASTSTRGTNRRSWKASKGKCSRLGEHITDVLSDISAAYAASRVKDLDCSSNYTDAFTWSNLLNDMFHAYRAPQAIPEENINATIDNLNEDANLALEEARLSELNLDDDLSQSIMRPISDGSLAPKPDVVQLVRALDGDEALETGSTSARKKEIQQPSEIFDADQKFAIDRLMKAGPDCLQYRLACPFAKRRGPNYKPCFFLHFGTLEGLMSHLLKSHHLDLSGLLQCDSDSAKPVDESIVWREIFERIFQSLEDGEGNVPSPHFDPVRIFAEVGLPRPPLRSDEESVESSSLGEPEDSADFENSKEICLGGKDYLDIDNGMSDGEPAAVSDHVDTKIRFGEVVPTSSKIAVHHDKACEEKVEKLQDLLKTVVLEEVGVDSKSAAQELEKLQDKDVAGGSRWVGRTVRRLMGMARWETPSGSEAQLPIDQADDNDDEEDSLAHTVDITDDTSRAMIIFYIAVFVEYETDRLPIEILEEGPILKSLEWYRSLKSRYYEPTQLAGDQKTAGAYKQAPSSNQKSSGQATSASRRQSQQNKIIKGRKIGGSGGDDDGDDEKPQNNLPKPNKPLLDNDRLVLVMRYRCICAIMQCSKHKACWEREERYLRGRLPLLKEHIGGGHLPGRHELLEPFRPRMTTWQELFLQTYYECGHHWSRGVRADPVVFVAESNLPRSNATMIPHEARISVTQAFSMVERGVARFRDQWNVPEYPIIIIDGQALVQMDWTSPNVAAGESRAPFSQPLNQELIHGVPPNNIEAEGTGAPVPFYATQTFPGPPNAPHPASPPAALAGRLGGPQSPRMTDPAELRYFFDEYYPWQALNQFTSPSPQYPVAESEYQSPVPSSPFQSIGSSPPQRTLPEAYRTMPPPPIPTRNHEITMYDRSSVMSGQQVALSPSFSDPASYDMMSSSPSRSSFPSELIYTIWVNKIGYYPDPDEIFHKMEFTSLDDITTTFDARMQGEFPDFNWAKYALRAHASNRRLNSVDAVRHEMQSTQWLESSIYRQRPGFQRSSLYSSSDLL